MHFLLEMYCQGSITMTVKWVLTGMDLTRFRVCRSSRPGNAGRLKKLFRNLQLLLERVSKWGLQIAEMVFRHALVIFHKFCSVVFVTMAIFLKCYTSLLLSLSFSFRIC